MVQTPKTVPTVMSLRRVMMPYPSVELEEVSSLSEERMVRTLRRMSFAKSTGLLPDELEANAEEPPGVEDDVVGAGATLSRVLRRDWDSTSPPELVASLNCRRLAMVVLMSFLECSCTCKGLGARAGR